MPALIAFSGWAKLVGALRKEPLVLLVGVEGSIGAVTSGVLKDVKDLIGRRKDHAK